MSQNILLVMSDFMAQHFKGELHNVQISNLTIINNVGSLSSVSRVIENNNPDIVLIYVEHLDDFDGNYQLFIERLRGIVLNRRSHSRYALILDEDKINPQILLQITLLGILDIFLTGIDKPLNLYDLYSQLVEPANPVNISDLTSGVIPRVEEKTIDEAVKKQPPKNDRTVVDHVTSSEPIDEDSSEQQHNDINVVNIKKKRTNKAEPVNQEVSKKISLKKEKKTVQLQETPKVQIKISNPKPVQQESKDAVPALKETRKQLPVPVGEPHINKKSHSILKKFFLILLILVLVIAVVLFLKGQKPTYDTLVNNQEYVKAAKLYPDKVDDLENDIVVKQNVASNQIRPLLNNAAFDKGTFVAFDRDFLKGDFDDAVEESRAISDDRIKDVHASMVSYAYLKTEDIDGAKKYAERTDDKGLQQKIDTVAHIEDSNKAYKDALDRKGLSSTDRNKLQNAIDENEKALKEV